MTRPSPPPVPSAVSPSSRPPSPRPQSPAGVEARALAQTGGILRQLAAHDGRTDGLRHDVSLSLAVLVETIGEVYDQLPEVLTERALRVVAAVDRATGQRR